MAKKAEAVEPRVDYLEAMRNSTQRLERLEEAVDQMLADMKQVLSGQEQLRADQKQMLADINVLRGDVERNRKDIATLKSLSPEYRESRHRFLDAFAAKLAAERADANQEK